jgi:3-oxosteroid 1-dehydrogenase
MATPSSSYDVVILGSGIAGLAGALAAHELGLQPVVLEKAAALGGGTVHSYGLIWVGQNHLARDAGISDSHDEVLGYMQFLGGGAVDEARLATFVARSPEVLKFFADCGIRFRLVRGVTDHYYDKAPGSHAAGRTLEAELISGVELGDWRDRVLVPHDVPCFYDSGGADRLGRNQQRLALGRRSCCRAPTAGYARQGTRSHLSICHGAA